MRDEDIDWLCYMTLSRGATSATVQEIADATGFPEEAVAASAERLVRAMLVQRRGDRVELLSIQDSLLLCQARYGKDVPFVIEDGVIKARRADDA
jgi:DNA-binding Lrp family transcriptional regulator